MLTRLTVVIISQHMRILNNYFIPLKRVLYVSYMSVEKEYLVRAEFQILHCFPAGE